MPCGFPPRQSQEESHMAEKNKFYKDFSNRKSFNNVPCTSDEVLVPVVLNIEMSVTLKAAGLDRNNIETWHFPHASKPVPVAFVPCNLDKKDVSMKWFNHEVERYLKHLDDKASEDLSLDKFMEDINNDDEGSFDPTATTEAEDAAALMYTFQLLLDQLAALDPKYAHVIQLLAEGFSKKEIIDNVELGKSKSQAYDYIKKAQTAAKELYDKFYR